MKATEALDKICKICLEIVWTHVDNGRPHVELAKKVLDVIQEYDNDNGR